MIPESIWNLKVKKGAYQGKHKILLIESFNDIFGGFLIFNEKKNHILSLFWI